MEGIWLDGKLTGYGYLVASEIVYDGYFKDGMKNGKGKATFKNGDRYDGWWASDEPQGTGVFTFVTGDRYEGNFSYGKRNGSGNYIY